MPSTDFLNIFGQTATQTATAITIQKDSLPMTTALVNGGEQTLAAIIKKAKSTLHPDRFAENIDQNITIEDGIAASVTRKENGIDIPYRKVQVIINFYERDEERSSGINPDKY